VSKPKSRPIDVEIYDQKYTILVQAALDEAEVRSLAEEVDTRMRKIAAVAGTPDSLRTAILTALHLAQEYRELRKNCEHTDAVISAKSAELSRALEQVLKR
jgi:cell division protein ZapA (FtsZ GTPase activity inhibitor)